MNKRKEKTDIFRSYAEKVTDVLRKLDYNQIDRTKRLLIQARDQDNKIYIFGNGGSGANASHIAGDYLKGASYKQEKKFRFICLNDNYTTLSAISNDISYDEIFALQLGNFLENGDLVIGLSGSGNSENIIRAIDFANKKGAITIAFSGYKGGKIKTMASHSVYIPINDMEITEDMHMMIFHMIKQSIIEEQSGSLEDMGDKYQSRIQ